jgi:hypothetical protein
MRRRVAGQMLVLLLAVAALMLARLLARPPGTSAGEGVTSGFSDRALVLAAVVAWGLPVAAGWIAWRMARVSYALVKHGIRTTGQVTVARQRGSRIQYSVGGLTYQIKSEWYVPASVGAAAPVVYPPGSPENGRVAHWQELWMPAILWLFVAVFFGVLDIWY